MELPPRSLLPAVCGLLPIALIIAIAIPSFVRARDAQRGVAHVVLEVSAEEVRGGGEFDVEFEGQELVLTIPPGSPEGTQIRLAGANPRGGDLVFELEFSEP